MSSHRFYMGQLVKVVCTVEGNPAVPIRARISSLKTQPGHDGRTYDCEVKVLDPVRVRKSSGGSEDAKEGQAALVMLRQLVPATPIGAVPATWDKCAWNPSMLKEDNE